MSHNPRKKSVLFVAPIPPPVHGAAYAMQYLLSGRVAEEFALLHVDSRFTDDVATLQKLTLRKLWLVVRYSWQIAKTCLSRRVDGVVLTPTFYFKPFLKDSVFIWLCRLMGKKVAAWIHMDFRAMRYESLPRWARWFVKVTLRRCRQVVIPAERLRQFMPAWLEPQRITALPNGLPAPGSVASTDTKSAMRVLYLSNIEDNKGWRTFLTAAREVGKSRINVEFVLHGAPALGLQASEIEAEIARDNLGGRIRWLGPVYDEAKWRALADAGIFCFPSWQEAFPLSVLEAMCAGLPIVATEVGGVPDAVIDGQGGFIVPPKDSGAMAAALLQLIDDSAACQAMGEFNRRRWEKEFTVEAFRTRWCDFLHGWLEDEQKATA